LPRLEGEGSEAKAKLGYQSRQSLASEQYVMAKSFAMIL
jgi:hypothetical protein